MKFHGLEEANVKTVSISDICENMDSSAISVIRVGSTDSQLYTECMNKLGVLTIKKPNYTNVDCEIEFCTSGTVTEKFYSFYFRGTLRDWKVASTGCVYGSLSEIPNLNSISDPTIADVCNNMEPSSIAIIRIGSTSSTLAEQCGGKLGVLTIKKPKYTNVDCELEYCTSAVDFEKFYSFYYRRYVRS